VLTKDARIQISSFENSRLQYGRQREGEKVLTTDVAAPGQLFRKIVGYSMISKKREKRC
jgi:hypothetical protein